MNAQQLSQWWRDGDPSDSHFLSQRRRVVGLNLLASAALGAVTLYQLGLIKSLPEPPLPFLDAERVDAAPEAYNRAGTATPDAALGLLNCAVSIVLAGMAGPDRSRTLPLLPLALAAKSVLDAANAGYLTWEQVAKHRALCSYCLVASAAMVAALPAALPEARAAWQHLRGAGQQS